MFKKCKQKNYMNKKNARENFNPNDDLIYIFREGQDQYNSDNFNNGLELDEDMDFRWYGNENAKLQIEGDNIPPESETNNKHKNDDNSFLNFDDDKKYSPI